MDFDVKQFSCECLAQNGLIDVWPRALTQPLSALVSLFAKYRLKQCICEAVKNNAFRILRVSHIMNPHHASHCHYF